MFQGSMVALATPMKVNGEIDRKAFSALIHWHLETGTSALVINGSTGESPTVSFEEQIFLLEYALEITQGRILIVAGTGTNSTKETIRRTKSVKALGVQACLLVTPYYNRPTQVGLLSHYQSVTNAVEIPILLYTVPGRTGCDLEPKTVARLSKMEHIIGIKDATGDLAYLKALQALCDPAFTYYSGDDLTSFAFMCEGGHGVISVTANVAPKAMKILCEAVLRNKLDLARAQNKKLMPLHQSLSVETNPIPVKWALNRLGYIENGIRLPLTTLSLPFQSQVEKAMIAAGVLV